MQKVLRFIRTPSIASRTLFAKTSSTSHSSPFHLRLRSYESRLPTSTRSQISMASLATGILPSKPVEETLGKRFWINFQNEWTRALYTPFVVCLAAGNLEIDTFRHYIAQDVHFLRTFAQVYDIAEECADDDDAKVGISKLRKSVLEELKMHDLVVKEWGVDLQKDSTPNSATVRYTDFLLGTASGKIEGVKAPGKLATPFEKTILAAYTLAAMTPCMRLYAFLGKELQTLGDSFEGTHPFQKWIDNYASENFQAAALQIEDLLETLSVSLTGEELKIIEKLYQQAMKLETEFFLAQPVHQKTAIPLSKEHNPAEHCIFLFSDFDLTCTVVDSSAILAEIAIITASKLDQHQSDTQLARMASTDLRSTWTELSKLYTEEYEKCIENVLLSDKVEKFDYEGLHKALENVSEFEKKANMVVIESCVLKGLNLEDIKRAGERMILQDGCINFFQTAARDEKLNTNIHVLSYCWSGDLIRSSFSSGGLDSVAVHANEFVYEDSLSTGEIVKKIESPIDKVQAFTSIVESSGCDKKILTVYIGDTMGDLLCLVKADIGIVIGSSSSLRKVAGHYGVCFVPLFPGVIEKQRQMVDWKDGMSGVLYTVSSWAEIHSFILGN